MIQDTNYEIKRALDDLPHIVGATCATAVFRASHNRQPTRIQYQECAAEYFSKFANQIANDSDLDSLKEYIKRRIKEETERILAGTNPEVERRYERYIDYG